MWTPMWSDTVKIESGGKYPLLLNRFHDHLEDFLIKGIVSTTDELRYISYCCWVIGDIEKSYNCKEYNEFVEAFRRRENALAIGLQLLNINNEDGESIKVYGRNTIKNIVSDSNKNYNCSFKLMKSANLGAYERYYKGTIFNWGLVWQDENGVIRLTESGKEIYSILEKHYSNSQYYLEYKGKKSVPGKVLEQWANINNYENIREEFCREERDFYKKIIFRLNQTKEKDYRRDTFAFYLECIKQCSENEVEFDENTLRNIHYFEKYYKGENNIINFNVPNHFEDLVFYWSIYELQVYFRWWISSYFKYFLQVLKSRENGISIDDFIETIDVKVFNAKICNYVGCKKDYFNINISEVLNTIKEITKIDDIFGEESITMNSEGIKTSDDLVDFILVMTGLFRKYESIKNDQRYLWLRGNLIEDFWFDNLFSQIGSILDLKVHEFLAYVLKKYVIDKHDLRMYEKGDLRRCWFTKEKGNYIFQADNESVIWRPAKFYNIHSFLFDMNLIEYYEDFTRLTKEGENLYNDLMEGFYNE
ncbi:hypothetical protein HCG68_01885 [Paeniclostridium sordellii]|nr:hypothetical protein [Paeniclostridium sordellii]